MAEELPGLILDIVTDMLSLNQMLVGWLFRKINTGFGVGKSFTPPS